MVAIRAEVVGNPVVVVLVVRMEPQCRSSSCFILKYPFRSMRTLLTLLCLTFGLLQARAQMADTLNVLCVGNSFTFYSNSHQMLVQIAGSQGHHIQMTAVYEGGYTFNRHLHDLKSIIAIERMSNPYHCVFLQDQSQMHARYASDTARWELARRDTRDLADRIRMYSPQARIWLESTWSYVQGNCGGFGTLERFDQLLTQGSALIAQYADTQVSPIGSAFAIARQERPDINLYEADQKHQSAYGSYLKSCVNYLLIYRTPFVQPVHCCDLDADACRYLQQVATRVVLGQ